MSNSSQTYPPRLLRYITAIVAATVPVAVGAVVQIGRVPPDAGTALGVGLFFAAALAAEYKPVPLDEQRPAARCRSAFVFLLSMQFLFGWQYAVLGAIGSMAIVQLHDRAPLLRGVFNASSCGLSAFALGRARRSCSAGTVSPHDAETLTLLVFLGGAAYVITNVVTVAIAVSLYTGPVDPRRARGLRPPLRAGVRDHGLHRRAGDVAVDDQPAAGAAAGRPAVRAGALPALRLPLGDGHPRRRDRRADRRCETTARFQTDLREALAMGASDALAADAGADRHRQLQEHQRSLRASGRRPGADDTGAAAARRVRRRPVLPDRRRGVRAALPDEAEQDGLQRARAPARAAVADQRSRTPSRSPSAPASLATRGARPTARSC